MADFEHAGHYGGKPAFILDIWPPNAFNRYDKSCDLYLVGKLFNDLRFDLSIEARNLEKLLKNQELQNCNDVWNYNWFRLE